MALPMLEALHLGRVILGKVLLHLSLDKCIQGILELNIASRATNPAK
jgi:hypothetical protein